MSLRPALDDDRTRLTPFVGRQDEIELLAQVFARAFRETSTQLVTVTGETGVGKSRLVMELLAAVDERPEPVFWLRGRCVPSGQGIAFWPLREMVRTQAGIVESDTPQQAAAKVAVQVGAIIPEPSERDWFAGRLAALAGAGPSSMDEEVERGEWFAAWQRFFQAVASTVPLILVFEDLQWAAPGLLDFIEQMVDWSTGVPLLALCTAGPGLYDGRPGWGGGKRASTTIGLMPLSSNDTVRLVSALLSQAVLPAETQQVLIERSGGNPLYAEEFVRMLMDRGILVRQGSAWRITPGVEIPVPETAQALIAARLAALRPDLRTLLGDASVFGKVFWSGGLTGMGGLTEPTVRDGLHELVRREMIRPARASSIRSDAEYSFWHPLVRDVIYDQIPPEVRPGKHLHVARWLDRLAIDRMDDQAEILAHQYEQALPQAERLDPDSAGEVRARAARAFCLAGDRASQLDAPTADLWYRRALTLRPGGNPERAATLVKAARTASVVGDFPEAVAHLQEAVDEFRARGEDAGAGEAMLDLSYLLWNQGWTAHSRELLAEAVDLLERHGPGPELAAAYAQMAGDRFISGRPREALEYCEKALVLADDLGLPHLRVRAREIRGMSRCDAGDWRGLEDLREALADAIELDLGYEVIRAYINYATFVTATEGPERALELYRGAVDHGERRGLVFWTMWTKAWALGVLFEVGDWDRLLTDAGEVLEWDPEHGESTFGVGALLCQAEVLAYRGRVDEALALAGRFVPRAREIGDPQVLAPALAVAAVCHGIAGDIDAAVAAVRELNDSVPQGASWVRSLFLQIEVRTLVEAGRLEEAERLLDSADRGTPRARVTLLTARAVLAEARREIDEAARLYERAAEGWGSYGFPLERGRALLGAGTCLAHLEETREAARALREARDVFERLRAGRLLAQADRTLELAARRSS